jgi:hypothetical protein
MSSGIKEKLRKKCFPLDFQLEFKDFYLRGHEPVKLIFNTPKVVENLSA